MSLLTLPLRIAILKESFNSKRTTGILAVFFIHKVESGVLNTHHQPTPYSRYVDDTCNQAPGNKGLTNLLRHALSTPKN